MHCACLVYNLACLPLNISEWAYERPWSHFHFSHDSRWLQSYSLRGDEAHLVKVYDWPMVAQDRKMMEEQIHHCPAAKPAWGLEALRCLRVVYEAAAV